MIMIIRITMSEIMVSAGNMNQENKQKKQNINTTITPRIG